MPAQPVHKADRPGKDWYSVSVETLQSWGLLLVLLGLVALGVFLYLRYDRQSLQRSARAVIEQAEAMRLRLSDEKRVATSFAGEYEAAGQRLDEARAQLKAQDFSHRPGQRPAQPRQPAGDPRRAGAARRRRPGAVRLLPGGGRVPARRRRRLAGGAQPRPAPVGRHRADGGQRLGPDHVPGRHALHGAPQHPVHRLAAQRRAERRAGAVDRDEVRLGQPEHLAGLEQRQDAGRRGPGQGVVRGLRRGRQGDQPGALRRLSRGAWSWPRTAA